MTEGGNVPGLTIFPDNLGVGRPGPRADFAVFQESATATASANSALSTRPVHRILSQFDLDDQGLDKLYATAREQGWMSADPATIPGTLFYSGPRDQPDTPAYPILSGTPLTRADLKIAREWRCVVEQCLEVAGVALLGNVGGRLAREPCSILWWIMWLEALALFIEGFLTGYHFSLFLLQESWCIWSCYIFTGRGNDQ